MDTFLHIQWKRLFGTEESTKLESTAYLKEFVSEVLACEILSFRQDCSSRAALSLKIRKEYPFLFHRKLIKQFDSIM